jgi:hypothetical protein
MSRLDGENDLVGAALLVVEVEPTVDPLIGPIELLLLASSCWRVPKWPDIALSLLLAIRRPESDVPLLLVIIRRNLSSSHPDVPNRPENIENNQPHHHDDTDISRQGQAY